MSNTEAQATWNRESREISARWTSADIPSQKGRSAIVTGTGGIGFENAFQLARAGSNVILAGRNPHKGAEAVAKIRRDMPSASVRFEEVDLASLKSVSTFTSRIRNQQDSLDLLINNAGVMTPPKREETSDRFELQFGVNYLSHFVLTLQLLPLLRNSVNARVVTLSSVAARQGAIDFKDLQAEQRYSPMRSYRQSKLACLMFAFELQRRSEVGLWGISSMASHPGIARTDLLHNAPGRGSAMSLLRTVLWFLYQPVSQGALPILFAATAPEARAGGYYGPNRLSETRGYPASCQIPPQAQDREAASLLWEISKQLASGMIPAQAEGDL
jgi:NAD(P)-dependent dehydrogenase (short-subunit alcohol dehydrogenase family)